MTEDIDYSANKQLMSSYLTTSIKLLLFHTPEWFDTHTHTEPISHADSPPLICLKTQHNTSFPQASTHPRDPARSAPVSTGSSYRHNDWSAISHTPLRCINGKTKNPLSVKYEIC